MATKTPGTRRPRPRSTSKHTSLIDWIEPDRNVRVLDWRERAQQFGLVPVGPDQERLPLASTSPERLLREEEPESLSDQPTPGSEAGATADWTGNGVAARKAVATRVSNWRDLTFPTMPMKFPVLG